VIAVLGATGQLGTAFMRRLGERATAITRKKLDLDDPASIHAWVKTTRPPLIINCAAYTAVDEAESHEAQAKAINTDAVRTLAEESERCGARFVTFSTDYVFDGTKATGYVESDAANPLSVYGRTKRDGERLALIRNPNSLIIRTSWLLSGTHPNFASTMLKLMRKGPVRVVDDQRGRPTLVDDLARSTLECVEAGVDGILHLANQGEATWYGLARQLASLAWLEPDQVEPCSIPLPATRPANSVLDSERIAPLGISPLPAYSESLRRVVDRLMR